MSDIGGFAYSFSDRLKFYAGHDVILDEISIANYEPKQISDLICHMTDHLSIDGFSSPTFFLTHEMMQTLTLENTSAVGLSGGGILKVKSAAFEGEVIVLEHTRQGKENHIGILAEKRHLKESMLSKEQQRLTKHFS